MRKMKWRRLLVSCIVAILVLSALSACGGREMGSQAEKAAGADTDQPGHDDAGAGDGADGAAGTGNGQAAQGDGAAAGASSIPDGGSGEALPLLGIPMQDLDGNEAKLIDIVGKSKVTMINCWGTFCGPCIREMPGLADLWDRYWEEGFQIVGVTMDVLDMYSGAIDREALQDARDIVERAGVQYPVYLAPPEAWQVFDMSSVPRTVFVDSQGKALTQVLIGAREEEDWEALVKDLLNQ